MGLRLTYAPGATPLDPDEVEGLIPRHIATVEQLNEWEHHNILEAQEWAFGRLSKEDQLSTDFMRRLHKRMLGKTWRWAGTYRSTEKNVGVAPEQIPVRLKDLCEDVRAQLAHRSMPLDEIAARFHHRLVLIHPFPNGNGRFGRLMTDLLLVVNGAEPFTWGQGDLVHEGDLRNKYIDSLRAADAKLIEPLFSFVRSGQ